MRRAEKAEYAFFVGIGGIGMSALARYLQARGLDVCGYDKTPSGMTTTLEMEGMEVVFESHPSAIPARFHALKPDELWVIRTPAVPEELPLIRAFEEAGHRVWKRAEALGEITRGRDTLAISGTHGKTTTTALLAHLMDASEGGCDAFLGGVSASTGSNLYLREGAPWVVVEADEFNRSFHTLFPRHAVITSMDPDHLEEYGTAEAFCAAFVEFAAQVEGEIVTHHSISERLGRPTRAYGWTREETPDSGWDFAAARVRPGEHGHTLFDWWADGTCRAQDVVFPMSGTHNLENAVAAAALATLAEVPLSVWTEALANFAGVKRRMEYRWRGELIYIDDYAHHPTEIERTIEAVRMHHPGRRITVIFQPHLYSRTRDQADEFARALGQVDHLILLPIYPARERPIPGVDSQWLFNKISAPHKELLKPELIFGCLEMHPPEVLLTLGAGDIDRLVPDLTKWAERQG